MSDKDKDLHCSFCGKEKGEVDKLLLVQTAIFVMSVLNFVIQCLKKVMMKV